MGQKVAERVAAVIDVGVRTIFSNAQEGDLGSVRDSMRKINRAVRAAQALDEMPDAKPFGNVSLSTFVTGLDPLVELRMPEEVKARVLDEFRVRKFL